MEHQSNSFQYDYDVSDKPSEQIIQDLNLSENEAELIDEAIDMMKQSNCQMNAAELFDAIEFIQSLKQPTKQFQHKQQKQ